jgi:AcrR family transcriptional regulator
MLKGQKLKSYKTELLIKNVYMKLCKEYGSDKVTVALLCREAGINRGTFYLHYNTIHELMEELEQQFAELMVKAWSDYKFDKDNKQIISSIFDCVKENGDLFYFHFNCSDGSGKKLYEAKLKELFIPQWLKHSTLTEKEANLILLFLEGGTNAIIENWVNNGFKDTEIHKKMYEEIAQNGLYSMVYLDL